MDANAIKNGVLAAFAFIGSFVANALGGWDASLQVLIALMVADYITGVLVAAVWHKSSKSSSGTLNSVAGFKGLLKKCAILALVWIGVLLDAATVLHRQRGDFPVGEPWPDGCALSRLFEEGPGSPARPGGQGE